MSDALPSGIVVTPSGAQLWIRTGTGIEVYNTSDLSHFRTINLGDPGDYAYRQNIVFNDAGTRAYTANITSGEVFVIDTANGTVLATVTTGAGANMVALTPDQSQL